MDQEVLLDSLRVAAAAYLLVIAFAAVFNLHRPLITYPFRVLYSSLSVGLEVLTRGRVHLAAPARQARRRGAHHLKNLRYAFREWRDERAEARGEVRERPQMTWTSAGKEPAPKAAALCPVHGVPLSTPLLFNEQSGEPYPAGTTHEACLWEAAVEPLAPPPAAPAPGPPPAPAPRPARPKDGLPRPPVLSPWDDEPAEGDAGNDVLPPNFRR